MSKIPGLNKFNEHIGSLKREGQVMRETLNRLQEMHKRKLKGTNLTVSAKLPGDLNLPYMRLIIQLKRLKN